MTPAVVAVGIRIAFAGTPEFARVALAALADAGFKVELVLTQPDRPAGRGLQLQASPVKQEALRRGIAVLQPRSLKLDGRFPEDAAAAQQALVALAPDALVVAAYGLILPAWTLALPRLGCLNIHGSLLPRWRGAAPIQRAIEAGDTATGITLMRMEQGLDTGPMIAAESVPIAGDETTGRLHDRLAALGAAMLVRTLPGWAAGGVPEVPQPESGVTYAAKIEKAEAAIDWRLPAAQIERRIRAFDPAPGAHLLAGGQAVKVWRARVCAGSAAPGTILQADAEGLVVACGEGALALLQLQRPGGKRVTAAEFLRSVPLAPLELLAS